MNCKLHFKLLNAQTLKQASFYVFLMLLQLISFCATAITNDIPSIDNYKEVAMQTTIQNNLKDSLTSLYQQGGHEVKKFGNIVIAYSKSPAPDFNMIFNFPMEKTTTKDLQQSLVYASKKPHPFILVQEQNNINADMQELISSFNYKKVGVATRMAMLHQNIEDQHIHKANIKLVTNNKMLEDWCTVQDETFELPQGTTKNVLFPIQNLLDKSFPGKLFIVYNDNLEPIATSYLSLPSNKQLPAGHYSWGVMPDYRKRGIMTNLVKYMLQVAKESGFSYSVAQCYDSSVRLAEKIGFEKHGELDIFTNG